MENALFFKIILKIGGGGIFLYGFNKNEGDGAKFSCDGKKMRGDWSFLTKIKVFGHICTKFSKILFKNGAFKVSLSFNALNLAFGRNYIVILL